MQQHSQSQYGAVSDALTQVCTVHIPTAQHCNSLHHAHTTAMHIANNQCPSKLLTPSVQRGGTPQKVNMSLYSHAEASLANIKSKSNSDKIQQQELFITLRSLSLYWSALSVSLLHSDIVTVLSTLRALNLILHS